MLNLKEHEHAGVIRDYYEALASGRINAGWYNLECRSIFTGLAFRITNSPSFSKDHEYRLVKTEKHPEVQLQELKERWAELKDKGTHELLRKFKDGGTFTAVSNVLLFEWPSFEYKIQEKLPELKKIDKSKLPVGTMTQYGRVQSKFHKTSRTDHSVNYKVHGTSTEVTNSEFVKILPSTEWIYWGGGESPIPNGLKVEYKMRDGTVSRTEHASCLIWVHHLKDFDIIAYRIIGISPGWTD